MQTDLPLMTGSRQEPARPTTLQRGQTSEAEHAFEEIFENFPVAEAKPARISVDSTDTNRTVPTSKSPTGEQPDKGPLATNLPEGPKTHAAEIKTLDLEAGEPILGDPSQPGQDDGLSPQGLHARAFRTIVPGTEPVTDLETWGTWKSFIPLEEKETSTHRKAQHDVLSPSVIYPSNEVGESNSDPAALVPESTTNGGDRLSEDATRQADHPAPRRGAKGPEISRDEVNAMAVVGKHKAMTAAGSSTMSLSPTTHAVPAHGAFLEKATAATKAFFPIAKPSTAKPMLVAETQQPQKSDAIVPGDLVRGAAENQIDSEPFTRPDTTVAHSFRPANSSDAPDFTADARRIPRMGGIPSKAVKSLSKAPEIAGEPAAPAVVRRSAFDHPTMPSPTKPAMVRQDLKTVPWIKSNDATLVPTLEEMAKPIDVQPGQLDPAPLAGAMITSKATAALQVKNVPAPKGAETASGIVLHQSEKTPLLEQEFRLTSKQTSPLQHDAGQTRPRVVTADDQFAIAEPKTPDRPSFVAQGDLKTGQPVALRFWNAAGGSKPSIPVDPGISVPKHAKPDQRLVPTAPTALGSERAIGSQALLQGPKRPVSASGEAERGMLGLQLPAKSVAVKSQHSGSNKVVGGRFGKIDLTAMPMAGRIENPDTVGFARDRGHRPSGLLANSKVFSTKTASKTVTSNVLSPLALIAEKPDIAPTAEGETGLQDIRSGGSTTIPLQTSGTPVFRPSPTVVFQQLQQALPRVEGNVLEIQLNPEELGRVRLQMSPTESGLSVQVFADRTDTLELLRRHVDILQRDLKDAGYAANDFTFGKQGSNHGSGHGGIQVEAGTDDAERVEQTQDQPPTPMRSGLDLRI